MAKQKPLPDLTKTGLDFLKAELDTGFTLADIALESEDPDKIGRNRKNARLAYDTVVRTKERVLLTEEQLQSVLRSLKQLRKKLQKLGEEFGD
jgi:hypothetical protein